MRTNLIGIMKVQTSVRNVKRKLGLPGALKEIVVDSEGEVGKARKAVGATEGTILCLRVRIETAEGEICNVGIAELNSDLERVLSSQIAHMVGELPQRLVGTSA